MNAMVRELLERARDDRLHPDDVADFCNGCRPWAIHALAVALEEGLLEEAFRDGALEGYELTPKGLDALEAVEAEDE